jgi:hypothetical protein
MSTWVKRIILVLILIFLTSITMLSFIRVKADSTEPITFSSGLAVYSPLNTSYNSYSVLVNVSFGCPYGIQSSLNYSIDGKYQDGLNMNFPSTSEPWSVPNYSPSNYYLFDSFNLPPLPNGPHQISFEIDEEANNYTAPPSSSFQRINGTNNYVATWVNTVSFTISSNDVFPTPTTILTPTLAPTPTSTSTVPEFPWLIILPLLLFMFSMAVIIRTRKISLRNSKHQIEG